MSDQTWNLSNILYEEYSQLFLSYREKCDIFGKLRMEDVYSSILNKVSDFVLNSTPVIK